MLRALTKTRGMLGFVALSIVFTFYAGAKSGSIAFMRTDADIPYLIDAGSAVSNDCVVLKFRTQVVPLSAPIYVESRENTQTNETDWVVIAEGIVGDFRNIVIPYPNAKNYNFRVYTDWTPGEAVHTNGVLNVRWGISRDEEGESLIYDDEMIAIPIKTDNFLIDEFGDVLNASPNAYTNIIEGLQLMMNTISNESEVTNEEL